MPTDRYRDVAERRERVYLGDAVYAGIDAHDRLILTTEDGIGATNVIVFEPAVVWALAQYLSAHMEKK